MRVTAVVMLLLSACGGVDLTVSAPEFESETLSDGANPFTVTFHVDGDLPDDSDDVYVTIEVKVPGDSSFVFEQNAQVERAKAMMEEPVAYEYFVNDGSGTYEFRAVIDAGSVIDEDDEDNNVSSVTSIEAP